MKAKGWKNMEGNICLSFIGFEGEESHAKRQKKLVDKIVAKHNGLGVGTGPGVLYDQKKFDTPYLRDFLLDRGAAGDVSETAMPWSKVTQVHDAAIAAAHKAYDELGIKGWIMSHMSHSYHSGACLYFTFAFVFDKDPLGEYDHVKSAIQQSFVDNGSSISHHHGVGLEHAPWLEQDISAEGVKVVSGLFAVTDPGANLNPRKIIADADACDERAGHDEEAGRGERPGEGGDARREARGQEEGEGQRELDVGAVPDRIAVRQRLAWEAICPPCTSRTRSPQPSPSRVPSSRSSRRSSPTACRGPAIWMRRASSRRSCATRGVTPATIAVLDGVPRIGLDDDGVRRIAEEDLAKASVRDLPILAARGGSGATTVAATAHLAALAGIRVFATGGLGGVHRGRVRAPSTSRPTCRRWASRRSRS